MTHDVSECVSELPMVTYDYLWLPMVTYGYVCFHDIAFMAISLMLPWYHWIPRLARPMSIPSSKALVHATPRTWLDDWLDDWLDGG